MKIPTKEGFYWAKNGNYKWFNLLCRVSGESPFLKIEAWHLFDDKLYKIDPSDITEWSDEITKPQPDPKTGLGM